MILEHTTHPRLIAEPVHIALIGAGGTGSQVLTGLARLDTAIRALGHPGFDCVTVYDPDTVTHANLGRQLFAPADVGQHKADVLVNRLNAWFGTRWHARTIPYDAREAECNIVISCVDTARARVEIGNLIDARYNKPYYWLDLGNRAADGQVVLGIPARGEHHAAFEYRMPTVVELFPELARNPARFDANDTPSCSLAQALERQELFINQLVATQALQLLWQIFRYGRTSWCGAFVNAESGRVTSMPIDPAAWARMGYVRPQPPAPRTDDADASDETDDEDIPF